MERLIKLAGWRGQPGEIFGARGEGVLANNDRRDAVL